MQMLSKHREEINNSGFFIIEGVFSGAEIHSILQAIQGTTSSNPNFRRSGDLFAIRQFLKELPHIAAQVLSNKLQTLIAQIFGGNYFVVKSIYFDKPEHSNWFVSYHQDLTISVDKKAEVDGFGPWSVKQNQYAVQPPLSILENNFTIRIHLDDTDEQNGALRVIPQSHLKGIYRPEHIDWQKETEVTCNVPQGGIMIMRPLLLHASSRTTNSKKRRVIHIEFSNQSLPESLHWSERLSMDSFAEPKPPCN